jgi:hypothetical protein
MKFRKYQMGGEVAPQAEQQPSMEEQLMGMAQQIAEQIQDPEAIMMLAQMLMEMAQGSPEPQAEAMPAEEAPAQQFKRGGKSPMMKNKYKSGSKMK